MLNEASNGAYEGKVIRTLALEDDDYEIMRIIMNIVYHENEEVPPTLTFEQVRTLKLYSTLVFSLVSAIPQQRRKEWIRSVALYRYRFPERSGIRTNHRVPHLECNNLEMRRFQL